MFKVWKESGERPVTYFRLIEDSNERVKLVVVDFYGVQIPGGIVFTINTSGTIRLHPCLCEDSNLQRDGAGHAVVEPA